LRTLLGSRECNVGNGPSDTAIAIVERVNGHKPEMGERGFNHPIHLIEPVEPTEE